MAEVSFTKKDPILLPGRRKNKWLIIAVCGLLVAGAGYGIYTKVASPAATSQMTQIVPVKRGDVAETISASGTVQAASQIKFSASNNAGKLTQVSVKVGDQVKAGQVLATIDDTAAKAQVANAQANLAAAQAKLQQVLQGTTPQALAVQQANLDKAKVTLDNAKTAYQNAQKLASAGNTQSPQLTSAKNLEAQAKKQLDTAQASLDAAQAKLSSATSADQPALQAAVTQAQAMLQQAQLSYQIAQDNVKITEQSAGTQDRSSVDQAKNSLDQAQASYNVALAQMNQTTAPPDAASVQSAEASVEQAKAQLEQQQANLANLTMTAPVDGVIAQVNGQVGELPANNTPVIVMNAGGANQLQITAQVSQTDVGKLKAGEETEFITSAFQGKTFKGQVLSVAPEATTQGGITSYTVLLSVDDPEQVLKPGMSGNVSILVGQHQNVLFVPPAALKTQNGEDGVFVAGAAKPEDNANADANGNGGGNQDQQPGANNADKQARQQNRQNRSSSAPANMHFQKVEIGYFSGERVEIVSGLTEDDKVVLTYDAGTAAGAGAGTKNNGLFNMGGGGGNRRGGN